MESEALAPTRIAPPAPYGITGPYKVRLHEFEGPLDLLLFFIKRDELDIHNIPITRITEEFLSYLKLMTALDLEVAGEFIVMAAELCQIKARMLLPREERVDGAEEDDPRTDLVRRLIEYRRFKEMAEELSTMSEEQRKVHFRQYFERDDRTAPAEEENLLKNVTIFHLMTALRRAMERAPRIKRTHDVEMVPLTVEEQSELILASLAARGELSFSELFLTVLPESNTEEFTPAARLWIAVTFVSILDLVRTREIAIRQHDVFDDIILFKP
ncbi:MAG: segregation/condensation protein A [Bacteroidota bacterium]|nr:segregation/condensation protein A [Bacteroidota bacterium]MDP4234729.1 segregation/condensation protein A [Bacteroidota bacterium]MDP4242621.1 segregation/condensation protein A [Bacteroidota bacterium]MDP4286817.1 segregation/condensation protein A [Bacteroidota bacterium]